MARVLVADDENNVRNFIVEALELDGHEAVGARDGKHAIELFEQDSSYDVLITDLRMPHVGGMDVATKLKEAKPILQVVIMTAYGNVQTAVDAMKMGALDYLQKPLKLSELRALVKRAERRIELELSGTDDEEAIEDAAEQAPQRRSAGKSKFKLTWGAPVMKPVIGAIERVAPTNANVLLFGESGVGKDVMARTVHALSTRSKGPFVAINCASISETLAESELFGHERGAFTGANESHPGLIEEAGGGTLFLDELGTLPMNLQAKLLRVLESGTYRRVGSSQVRQADVRWIAATNENLRHMVELGSFRKDLYHRLAIFPLVIPPLRKRRTDIAPLARLLLSKLGENMGRATLELTDDAAALLTRHNWPGNVRELRNTLERAAILATGNAIDRSELMLAGELAAFDPDANEPVGDEGFGVGPEISEPEDSQLLDLSLYELEKRAIEHALALHDGKRKAAAEHLGIPVRSLYNKIKRFGLET